MNVFLVLLKRGRASAVFADKESAIDYAKQINVASNLPWIASVIETQLIYGQGKFPVDSKARLITYS